MCLKNKRRIPDFRTTLKKKVTLDPQSRECQTFTITASRNYYRHERKDAGRHFKSRQRIKASKLN